MAAEVVITSLMAEVHLLVSPLRCHKLRVGDDISDVLLFASWRLLSKDLVQESALLNCHELLKKILSVLIREADVAIGDVSDSEW